MADDAEKVKLCWILRGGSLDKRKRGTKGQTGGMVGRTLRSGEKSHHGRGSEEKAGKRRKK